MPLANGPQLLREEPDEAGPHPPLWRVVEGVGVGDEAIVQGARRLVVRHAAVEVAAIVAVYGVAVHRNEAAVSLGQRLARQVRLPLRIWVARRLAALRGFVLLGPGGTVARVAVRAALSSRVPLLLRRRLVPLRGRRAAGSWSRRLR